MTIAPTVGPVQRPGDDRDLTEIFQRVGDLERYPPGRWIYAGTYPGDPLTTPDSPAFQNGISGFLRFRVTREKDLQVEADIVGMSPGDVVTNVSAFYRPQQDGYGVGSLTDSGAASGVTVWQITTTGDLIYVGAITGGGPGSDTTAIHYDVANVGGILDVVVNALSGTPPNTEFAGQAAMLLSMLGAAGFFPIVVRITQDNGANWSEYAFGYGGLDMYAADLRIWDDASNLIHQLLTNGDAEHYLQTSRAFTVYDSGFGVRFKATEDGQITVNLGSGNSLIVNDSSANPRLQVDEDGTITLTAKDLIAALEANRSLTVYDSGGNPLFQINESGDMNIASPFNINVQAISGDFGVSASGKVILNAGDTVEITPTNDLIVNLAAGKKITINDSAFNPMLQMTEGSPDLHIPTGGSVIADL